jgi:ADP-heptose:LPS heptosyltransferase
MRHRDPTVVIFGRRYLRGGSRGAAFVFAVAVFDSVARVLLGRTTPRGPPLLGPGSRLVVAKIDHLGDLMQATPFLCELRRQAPDARIALLVGSWCEELARILCGRGLAHEVVTYDAWSLNLKASWPKRLRDHIATFRQALARVQDLAPDCYVDLRPFTPNSLLLARLANVPFRVGFGLRGLAYTLHREVVYRSDRPFGQLFLDGLTALGLRAATYGGPALSAGAFELTPSIACLLPDEPFVLAHLGSRSLVKEIPRDRCVEVLRRICESVPIVAVGTQEEAQRYHWLGESLPAGRLVNLMGRTSLSELLAVAERSAGGVVSESFVAHALLAFERPTLVLMANRFAVRAPYPLECSHLWLVDARTPPVELKSELSAFRDAVAGATQRMAEQANAR